MPPTDLPQPRGTKRKVLHNNNNNATTTDTFSQSHFDFVVKTQPRYIAGTGPPLAPISIMPLHDKEGIILDFITIQGVPQYMVGYKDSRLQVGVQPKHICDWVSQRTLENYEYDQTKIRTEEEKTKEHAKKLAAEQRRRKKEEKLAQTTQSRGRKRKQTRIEAPRPSARVMGREIRADDDASASGPGRRRRKQEEPLDSSPQAQRAPNQPTLSTPSKGRGLADLVPAESESSADTDDEDETEIAVGRQLADTSASHDRRRSSFEQLSDRSTSSSPEPIPVKQRTFSNMSSSKKRHSLDNAVVASSSSREALKTYETLESSKLAKPQIKTPSKGKSIAQRYSMFTPGSSKPGKHIAYPKDNSNSDSEDAISHLGDDCGEDDDEENNGGEWEINEICDERHVKKRGKIVLQYLINWVGDWSDTWEKAENVGHASIADWERKKKKKRLMGYGEDLATDELSMDHGGKDKRKRKATEIDSASEVDEYMPSSKGRTVTSSKTSTNKKQAAIIKYNRIDEDTDATADDEGMEEDYRPLSKGRQTTFRKSGHKKSKYIPVVDGGDSSDDGIVAASASEVFRSFTSVDPKFQNNRNGTYQTMGLNGENDSIAATDSDPDAMFVTDRPQGKNVAPEATVLEEMQGFGGESDLDDDELETGSVIL